MNKWLLIFFTSLFTIAFSQENVNVFYPSDNVTLNQNHIKLQWNLYASNELYSVQISKDEDFNEIVINEEDIEDIFFMVDYLQANEKYYWRVKSTSSAWSDVRVFYLVDFKLWDEIEFILDPDSVLLDSNNKIEVLKDLSGNNYNFEQLTASKRPSNINLSEVNSTLIDFNPLNETSLSTSTSLADLEEGEIFSFVKVNETPAPSVNASGIWRFSNLSSSGTDHYPYTNNGVYFGFGRSSRSTIGDISNAVDLTVPHVLNLSTGDDLILRINNTELYSSSSGSVSFPAEPLIGASYEGQKYFNGQFGQVLMFNTVLSDSLRNVVNDYYRHKYAPPVNLGQNISLEYDLCGDLDTLRAAKHFKSYLWSDGSTADSLVVTQAGDYWVEVVDVFGNISRDTIRIAPKLAYPTKSVFCEGGNTTWDLSYLENYSFLWSNGETSSGIAISEVGDYYVTLTDTNNCSYTSDTLHFIKDDFPSTASLGPDIDLCVGNQLGLSSGAEEAITYLWSTGATTPEIPLSTSGEYSVVVTNINGCEAKDTVLVNIVGAAPAIAYSIPEMVCLNSEAVFQDASASTDGATINAWEWVVLSDTLSGNPGIWLADSAGVFDIHYTIGTSSGCFSDTTFTFEVKDNPIVTINNQGDCQDTEITFTGGQLTPTPIETWQWGFPGETNPLVGQTIAYTYAASGNQEVELIGIDVFGCVDTLVETIAISPAPNVEFQADDICAGQVVDFHNNTTIDYPGIISNYQWYFGDGTTSGQTNPTKPFPVNGDYEVTLSAHSNEGCMGEKTSLVKVHAMPVINHSMAQACAKLETTFTDESFVANGSVADVDWSFNATPPINGLTIGKVFDFPGSYHVKQTVKSAFGCNHSVEYMIEIAGEVKADFEMEPHTLVAAQETEFSSTSIGANHYYWEFGDFATATQPDTSLVFTEEQIGEEIEITLTVSNDEGCEHSKSVSRTVIGRDTDLAILEIFHSEVDGYTQIGVRMKNNGFTPIEEVELTLYKPGLGTLKETWNGLLEAGEEVVYVFQASLKNSLPLAFENHDYICIKGRLISHLYEEEDLTNNEVCQSIPDNQTVVVLPYPNPISDFLNLKIVSPKEQVVSVDIIDPTGRYVYRSNHTVILEGMNTISIDAKAWAVGSYKILLISEDEQVIVGVVR